MNKKVTSANKVLNTLYTISYEIQQRIPGLIIDENEKSYNFITKYNPENKQCTITLGTKALRENEKVFTHYAAYILMLPFHEEKHVIQFKEEINDRQLIKQDATIRQISIEDMINTCFPEHYTVTYFESPIEAAAEMYGIKTARKFFNDNKWLQKETGIDFEKDLIDALNDRNVIPKWYAKRQILSNPMTNIDNAINRLQDTLNIAIHPEKRGPYREITTTQNIYNLDTTHALMPKMNNAFKEKLKTAHNLDEQQSLLIKAIRKYEKEYFNQNKDILPFIKRYFNDTATHTTQDSKSLTYEEVEKIKQLREEKLADINIQTEDSYKINDLSY